MAGSVTHQFVSAAAQGADATKVRKNDWNANHVIDLSAEYTSSIHADLRATCTGDGVADDTSAIATIVAAVIAAGGGSIFVAPAKTFLTDRIVISNAVTVRFYGGGTLKLRTASDSLAKMSNASGTLLLDGIKLDGNNLALTSGNANALAYTVAGQLTCYDVEVFNAGTTSSGVSGGIASNSGGTLTAKRCNIHDCRGFGIHVQGNGRADVSHNLIHDLGNTGVMVGPINNGSTDVVSDGWSVCQNKIWNISADLGGSGQHGNGINCYRNAGGEIIGNHIVSVAFSFIRSNDCDDVTIIGNFGKTAGETAAYSEFQCNNNIWQGNRFTDIVGSGINVVNVAVGVKSIVVSGNIITDFGKSVGPSAGIVIEYGIATGNFVDGNNNAQAIWGIRNSPGGGVSSTWFSQVIDNQIAGCKYDIGTCASITGGTQRMIVGGTFNVRQDANYSSAIGAVAGSTTDGGIANTTNYGATIGAKTFWDTNYWNVTTANAPPAGEIGSRMKINGAWVTSTGSAWA